MVIVNKSIGLALLCIISWSFIPVISKIATSDITPLQLLFLSNALSSLMIGVVLILRRKQIGDIKIQLKSNIFPTIFLHL